MDTHDFNKLLSLLSKLENATKYAYETDDCFKRYHGQSLSVLKEIPVHLRRLEQGLKTAKVVAE